MATVEELLTAAQAVIDARSVLVAARAAISAKELEIRDLIPAEFAAAAAANDALETAYILAQVEVGYAAVQSDLNDANAAMNSALSTLEALAPGTDPGV